MDDTLVQVSQNDFYAVVCGRKLDVHPHPGQEGGSIWETPSRRVIGKSSACDWSAEGKGRKTYFLIKSLLPA